MRIKNDFLVASVIDAHYKLKLKLSWSRYVISLYVITCIILTTEIVVDVYSPWYIILSNSVDIVAYNSESILNDVVKAVIDNSDCCDAIDEAR